MDWEESKYKISACRGWLVSLEKHECPDEEVYLIVRMPWLKSRGRRCSCSRVNWSESSIAKAPTNLAYLSLPPMTATLPS